MPLIVFISPKPFLPAFWIVIFTRGTTFISSLVLQSDFKLYNSHPLYDLNSGITISINIHKANELIS